MYAFTRKHHNCQVHRWCNALFTSKSMFTLSICDVKASTRWWILTRYNIIQQDKFGGVSVTVWGEIPLEDETDLHVITISILTAVMYQDEILKVIVRTYAGAAPGTHSRTMQDNV